MNVEETIILEQTLLTHTWCETHVSNMLADLAHTTLLTPDYFEFSTHKLYVRATIPASIPATRYDKKQWGRNPAQVSAIFSAILESVTKIHQFGCLMRSLSLQNIRICTYRKVNPIQIIGYYTPSDDTELYLSAMCPEYFLNNDSTIERFGYFDQLDELKMNLNDRRKFLALPPVMRIRQRVRFTVGCDLYQIGQFLYQLVTTELPPSPFIGNNWNDDRLLVIDKLQQLKHGDTFNNIVLKLLFLDNDYYLSAQEALFEYSTAKAMLKGENFPRWISFNQLSTDIKTNMTYHNLLPVTKQVIDHITKCLCYKKLNELGLAALRDKYQASNIIDPTIVQQELQIKGPIFSSSDKTDVADDKTGKLCIIQGYFGSGKTQILMEIAQFFTKYICSFVVYIPTKEPWKSIQNREMATTLLMINQSFKHNPYKDQPLKILDFYHYLIIYFCQALTNSKSQLLLQGFKQRFHTQANINLITSICPGFALLINLGKPDQILEATSNQCKDFLNNFITFLLTYNLLVIIQLDDFQSNVFTMPSRILLDLLKMFPRLAVITSEVPTIPLQEKLFTNIDVDFNTESQATKKILELFYPLTNVFEQLQEDTQLQSKELQDVLSLGSYGSASLDSNFSSDMQSQQIRTNTYIYGAAQRRKVQTICVAVNYMTEDQVAAYLQLYNISRDTSHFLYMKTLGSIKQIDTLLLQLFQHSSIFANYVILQSTIKYLQISEIFQVYHFVTARAKKIISNKEMEILQVASCLPTYINIAWLQHVLDLNSDEIHIICNNLTNKTSFFTQALDNCQLKHVSFDRDLVLIDYSQIESYYVWLSPLIKQLISDNFKQRNSHNLIQTVIYLHQKFYFSKSILENKKSLTYFTVIPRFQDDQFKLVLDELQEEIKEILDESSAAINQDSSFCKFLKRHTRTVLKLDSLNNQIEKIAEIQSLNNSDILKQFSGIFVSCQQLLDMTIYCQQIFADICDQYELLKLNSFQLCLAKYFGLTPVVYYQYLDLAVKQRDEIVDQINIYQTKELIQVNDTDLQLLMTAKEQHIQLYQKFLHFKQKLSAFDQNINIQQIHKLRTNQFQNINSLNIQKLNCNTSFVINQLTNQFILNNKYQFAAKLLVDHLYQIGYKLLLQNDDFLQNSYAVILHRFLSQPIQLTEETNDVSKLVLQLIEILILNNQEVMAFNISVSFINNIQQFDMFSLNIAQFALTNNNDYQDAASLANSSIASNILLKNQKNKNLYIHMISQQVLFCQRLSQIPQIQILINKFMIENYLFLCDKMQEFDFMLLQLVVTYLSELFLSNQFNKAAKLSQFIMYGSQYINIPQLQIFSLICAICSKRMLSEDFIDPIPDLQKLDLTIAPAYIQAATLLVLLYSQIRLGNNLQCLMIAKHSEQFSGFGYIKENLLLLRAIFMMSNAKSKQLEPDSLEDFVNACFVFVQGQKVNLKPMQREFIAQLYHYLGAAQ